MDGTGFLLFYLYRHVTQLSVLVLIDSAKQLAVMGKIYKPKKNLFRSSRSQPSLLVFNSDLKLRATKTLIGIKACVLSYFYLHPSMTKPAFQLKIAFPCHTTDHSIYCVFKIGTYVIIWLPGHIKKFMYNLVCSYFTLP